MTFRKLTQRKGSHEHFRKSSHAILIKVNQMELTATLQAMKGAAAVGYTSMVSHRPGENGGYLHWPTLLSHGAGPDQTGSASVRSNRTTYNKTVAYRGGVGASLSIAGQTGVTAEERDREGARGGAA